jgi:hypothetical protein
MKSNYFNTFVTFMAIAVHFTCTCRATPTTAQFADPNAMNSYDPYTDGPIMFFDMQLDFGTTDYNVGFANYYWAADLETGEDPEYEVIAYPWNTDPLPPLSDSQFEYLDVSAASAHDEIVVQQTLFSDETYNNIHIIQFGWWKGYLMSEGMWYPGPAGSNGAAGTIGITASYTTTQGGQAQETYGTKGLTWDDGHYWSGEDVGLNVFSFPSGSSRRVSEWHWVQ